MLRADLKDLQQTMSPKLDEIQDPMISLHGWLQLATQFPNQWKLLVKSFIVAKVREQEATVQMGARGFVPPEQLEALVVQCTACPRVLPVKKALEMHCKRKHGVRPEARNFVLRSVSLV